MLPRQGNVANQTRNRQMQGHFEVNDLHIVPSIYIKLVTRNFSYLRQPQSLVFHGFLSAVALFFRGESSAQ